MSNLADTSYLLCEFGFPFGCCKFGGIRFDGIMFGGIWFGGIMFGGIKFGGIWRCWASWKGNLNFDDCGISPPWSSSSFGSRGSWKGVSNGGTQAIFCGRGPDGGLDMYHFAGIWISLVGRGGSPECNMRQLRSGRGSYRLKCQICSLPLMHWAGGGRAGSLFNM